MSAADELLPRHILFFPSKYIRIHSIRALKLCDFNIKCSSPVGFSLCMSLDVNDGIVIKSKFLFMKNFAIEPTDRGLRIEKLPRHSHSLNELFVYRSIIFQNLIFELSYRLDFMCVIVCISFARQRNNSSSW